MSVANQKIIKVEPRLRDENHLFGRIGLNAAEQAIKNLTGEAFKIWFWIDKNQDNYQFELSQKAFENLGVKKDSYYRGIKQLEEYGYLVRKEDGSNIYIFYEGGNSQNAKTNMQVSANAGLNTSSSSQNAKENSQNAKSFSQNQQRNTTNTTINTTDMGLVKVGLQPTLTKPQEPVEKKKVEGSKMVEFKDRLYSKEYLDTYDEEQINNKEYEDKFFGGDTDTMWVKKVKEINDITAENGIEWFQVGNYAAIKHCSGYKVIKMG